MITNLISRGRFAFEAIRKRFFALSPGQRRAAVASSAIVLILLTVLIWVAFLRGYSLNKNVTTVYQVIPANTIAYLEIKDTERLRDLMRESEIGRAIGENPQWQNLLLSPEFNDLFSVLQVIESKTGFPLSLSSVPDLFDDSIGIAFMDDGSRLFVAQTNLKSQIGISLLSALRAEEQKMQIPDRENQRPAPEQTNEEEAGTDEGSRAVPEVYPSRFSADQIILKNLVVNRIEVGGKRHLYFVILDHYLFVSDSMETLRLSMAEAAGGTGGILSGKNSRQPVIDEYARDDSLLFALLDTSRSAGAPLLSPFISGRNAAFIIRWREGRFPEGSIYNTDFKEGEGSTAGETPSSEWEKQIPLSVVLAIFSETGSPEKFIEKLTHLDGYWRSLSSGLLGYIEAAKIEPKKAFPAGGGFALSYHGMERSGGNVIPNFSFLYASANGDDSLLLSLFSHRKKIGRSYQGLNYSTYGISGESHYSPSSAYLNQREYLASSESILREFLSARRGNRPVLPDAGIFQGEATTQRYPVHIVLNLQGAFENLIQFYKYGAEHSEEYTERTIENDIAGLFKPFADLRFLHIALGADEAKMGLLQIIGR
jgi:hypothetical protein